MKTKNLVWGIILVFIGGIFLLENFDVIEFSWRHIWRFWPVILILIGVNILFTRSEKNSGVLISAIITILVLGFITYKGIEDGKNRRSNEFGFDWKEDWRDEDNNGDRNGATTKANFTEPYTDSVKIVSLNVYGGASNYKINETTNDLFSADIKQKGNVYSLQRTDNDSVTNLTLRMKDKRNYNFSDDDFNKVNMLLNTAPTWDIQLKMGAGKADFDLTNYKVRNLELQGGAAGFDIKLGDKQAESNLNIETGVAEVKINIPQGSGCRIKANTGLSIKDFDGFNKINGNLYETENFKTAKNKINITIKSGLSDFEVNRY